jgi:hypothetical protein
VLVAVYTLGKTVLAIFNAADVTDRWAFELTPAFLAGLANLQLAFLSALVAGANAWLHRSFTRRTLLLGMAMSGVMAVSLILGMQTTRAEFAAVNVERLVALFALLASVGLDHFGLARAARINTEDITVPSEERFACLLCGAFVDADAEACSVCGAVFKGEPG